jgi:hypothetical protein
MELVYSSQLQLVKRDIAQIQHKKVVRFPKGVWQRLPGLDRCVQAHAQLCVAFIINTMCIAGCD